MSILCNKIWPPTHWTACFCEKHLSLRHSIKSGRGAGEPRSEAQAVPWFTPAMLRQYKANLIYHNMHCGAASPGTYRRRHVYWHAKQILCFVRQGAMLHSQTQTCKTNWAQINCSGANFFFRVGAPPPPLITWAQEKWERPPVAHLIPRDYCGRLRWVRVMPADRRHISPGRI